MLEDFGPDFGPLLADTPMPEFGGGLLDTGSLGDVFGGATGFDAGLIADYKTWLNEGNSGSLSDYLAFKDDEPQLSLEPETAAPAQIAQAAQALRPGPNTTPIQAGLLNIGGASSGAGLLNSLPPGREVFRSPNDLATNASNFAPVGSGSGFVIGGRGSAPMLTSTSPEPRGPVGAATQPAPPASSRMMASDVFAANDLLDHSPGPVMPGDEPVIAQANTRLAEPGRALAASQPMQSASSASQRVASNALWSGENDTEMRTAEIASQKPDPFSGLKDKGEPPATAYAPLPPRRPVEMESASSQQTAARTPFNSDSHDAGVLAGALADGKQGPGPFAGLLASLTGRSPAASQPQASTPATTARPAGANGEPATTGSIASANQTAQNASSVPARNSAASEGSESTAWFSGMDPKMREFVSHGLQSLGAALAAPKGQGGRAFLQTMSVLEQTAAGKAKTAAAQQAFATILTQNGVSPQIARVLAASPEASKLQLDLIKEKKEQNEWASALKYLGPSPALAPLPQATPSASTSSEGSTSSASTEEPMPPPPARAQAQAQPQAPANSAMPISATAELDALIKKRGDYVRAAAGMTSEKNQTRMKMFIENIDKQIAQAAPTPEMREYAFSMAQNQAARKPVVTFTEWRNENKRAGATKVEVNSGEKSYDGAIGKSYADKFIGLQNDADAARAQSDTLSLMRGQMETPGFRSGAGAELELVARRGLVALGVTDPKAVASMENFAQLSNESIMKGLGGSLGQGISNADRDFLKGMVASLQNTPEGNRQRIEAMEKINARKVQIAQLARDYAKRNGGRIDAGFDDEMRTFAEANPLFPKKEPEPGGGKEWNDLGNGVRMKEKR